ncbi:MAG: ChrR family anti-sigma-E factor [Sulfitobacter sp.]
MTQHIKHHLDDATLMGYTTGVLPEAFNLIVATHLSLCDSCRAQAASFEALGGEVLEQTKPDAALAPIGKDSLDATFALIETPQTPSPQPAVAKPGVLPAPLQAYVGGDLEAVKWRAVGLGVKQAILPTSKNATARLLLIPAGAAMPDHGHQGTEITMVLKGAFHDEDDYFARGDVEIADSDMHHTPVADIKEDCICLAVSDAPLKFSGLIPRIAQRFLRI